jgi:hypothetical protein
MQTEIISLNPLVPKSSLKQSAVEDFTAQVIDNAKAFIPDPLDRYARLRVLKTIIDKVVEDAGAQAEFFCEQRNIGSDGNDFNYNGLIFRRQFILDYNYAANATDIKGKRIPYKETLREIQYYDDQLKSNKKILKGYEAQIELAHPNMVPDVVRVAMSYRGVAN